jgi:hypothetical protein
MDLGIACLVGSIVLIRQEKSGVLSRPFPQKDAGKYGAPTQYLVAGSIGFWIQRVQLGASGPGRAFWQAASRTDLLFKKSPRLKPLHFARGFQEPEGSCSLRLLR